MFPYVLIIPVRFNYSLAGAVTGAAKDVCRTFIRLILQEEAA